MATTVAPLVNVPWIGFASADPVPVMSSPLGSFEANTPGDVRSDVRVRAISRSTKVVDGTAPVWFAVTMVDSWLVNRAPQVQLEFDCTTTPVTHDDDARSVEVKATVSPALPVPVNVTALVNTPPVAGLVMVTSPTAAADSPVTTTTAPAADSVSSVTPSTATAAWSRANRRTRVMAPVG